MKSTKYRFLENLVDSVIFWVLATDVLSEMSHIGEGIRAELTNLISPLCVHSLQVVKDVTLCPHRFPANGARVSTGSGVSLNEILQLVVI